MNENYTPCPNSFATSGKCPAVASPWNLQNQAEQYSVVVSQNNTVLGLYYHTKYNKGIFKNTLFYFASTSLPIGKELRIDIFGEIQENIIFVYK